MNQSASTMLIILVLISSCVSPPEYTDGLLENIPAVVNETDYFSLSILGDDYTDEKDWDIELTTVNTDIILSTLVIKDLNINPSDSSYLYLMRESGDTIFTAPLLSELVWTSQDSIGLIGSPKKVAFSGNNFTGRLEYQIIKNPLQ
ncbi:MAG: hypothetical protein VX600_00985 [Candidatus Neomarinimicrobiota bacterium]|nr:hypothetical protein [Candidatus Neomarinimicrobiota bacterium]